MTRMSMSARSDRDVIPLVRMRDSPPRALSRGLEAGAVQFTITRRAPSGPVVVTRGAQGHFRRRRTEVDRALALQPRARAASR